MKTRKAARKKTHPVDDLFTLHALGNCQSEDVFPAALQQRRLDGHIVQGHVDCTAVCESVEEVDGSHYYKFVYEVDPAMASKGYVTVEKGSVTVNGVSLTVCDSERNSFRVAIIPYTFEHTNFKNIVAGTRVNLEFDIIGKYLSRLMEFQNK